MGDNFNLIIIKPAQIASSPDFLRYHLGFGAAVHSYLSKFRRYGFDLWIGDIGNCLIIECDDAFRLTRLAENGKNLPRKGREFLEKISRLFPDSQIAALYAESRIGRFGYSIFERGELIRCSFGAATGHVVNYGSRMPFEDEYISSTYQSFKNEDRTFYRLNASSNGEELPEFAIGGALAAELFHAFTGFKIDSAEAAKSVGVGFLEGQLRFDPQTLLSDQKLFPNKFSRRPERQHGFILRNAAMAFGTIFLIWVILISTR